MTHRLTDLEEALRELGDAGNRIAAFDPGPEDLDEIAAGLARAHRALAAARGIVGRSGCRQHPTGPVDQENGGCLLCATARRRGQLPEQPARPAATPLTDICQEVAEHGHDEAVLRHGAPAVARALLRCRNTD